MSVFPLDSWIKSLNPSKCLFPHLENGVNNSNTHQAIVRVKLNIYVNHLAWYKYSVTVNNNTEKVKKQKQMAVS